MSLIFAIFFVFIASRTIVLGYKMGREGAEGGALDSLELTHSFLAKPLGLLEPN